MRKEIDSFITLAAEAETEAVLNRIFLSAIQERGYRAFDAYRHRVAEEVALEDPSNFVVASYNLGILEPYLQQGMAAMCPVLARLSEETVPLDYLAFLERLPESSTVRWQRRTLRAFLVQHAWCVPLNTVHMVKGVTVYMASTEPQTTLFLDTKHEIMLLSVYYMEALESFRPGSNRPGGGDDDDGNPISDDVPSLSAREVDCLHWAAIGKSNPEIGAVLALSPNTVQFHMKNAFRKLGVGSRVTAVVRAQDMGII